MKSRSAHLEAVVSSQVHLDSTGPRPCLRNERARVDDPIALKLEGADFIGWGFRELLSKAANHWVSGGTCRSSNLPSASVVALVIVMTPRRSFSAPSSKEDWGNKMAFARGSPSRVTRRPRTPAQGSSPSLSSASVPLPTAMPEPAMPASPIAVIAYLPADRPGNLAAPRDVRARDHR